MHSFIHSFISFHFISFHFMSFHVISCHFMSFHVISFMSFHVISFHFMSFHVISCHSFTYLVCWPSQLISRLNCLSIVSGEFIFWKPCKLFWPFISKKNKKNALPWAVCVCVIFFYMFSPSTIWLAWKSNMEPKNGGLEDDVPFQLGACWVSTVNFQGCKHFHSQPSGNREQEPNRLIFRDQNTRPLAAWLRSSVLGHTAPVTRDQKSFGWLCVGWLKKKGSRKMFKKQQLYRYIYIYLYNYRRKFK